MTWITTTANGWGFDYAEKHSVLMCESWLEAVTARPENPDFAIDFLFESVGGYTTGYRSERQTEKSMREGLVFLKQETRAEFSRGFVNAMDEANAFYENYARHQEHVLPRYSDADLGVLFKEYFRSQVNVESFFKMSAGRAYPLLEERLKDELKRKLPEDEVENAYGTLLTPETVDVLQREEADLLRLSKKGHVAEEGIGLHSRKYAFHYYNTYDREAVHEFIRERVSKLKGMRKTPERFLGKLREKKRRLSAVQRELEEKIDENFAGVARFLREQGSLRFEMKNVWAAAEYRFLSLFEEIARRAGLPVQELFASYKNGDYENLLFHGIKLGEEERRKRGKAYVFWVLDGRKGFLSGDEAKAKASEVLGEPKKLTELKGTPASSGKVRGRVRFVDARGLEELREAAREFKQGEILVTPMTQPNMVVLMKLAAAIVTDSGGMTSHAAIVSRELGIPCVVGTRIATKALKTGDFVEVDAFKGTVRKL